MMINLEQEFIKNPEIKIILQFIYKALGGSGLERKKENPIY